MLDLPIFLSALIVVLVLAFIYFELSSNKTIQNLSEELSKSKDDIQNKSSLLEEEIKRYREKEKDFNNLLSDFKHLEADKKQLEVFLKLDIQKIKDLKAIQSDHCELILKLKKQIEIRDNESHWLKKANNMLKLDIRDHRNAVALIWGDFCSDGELKDELLDYFPTNQNNYEVVLYEGV